MDAPAHVNNNQDFHVHKIMLENQIVVVLVQMEYWLLEYSNVMIRIQIIKMDALQIVLLNMDMFACCKILHPIAPVSVEIQS